ncbi:hypothetical protein ACMHYJ_09935 [Castellaniella hirudinis]|uniref:hypothetical protein n=1 Tax=Castellaniella hirudinis TaxID=1144617 RepID=UPI0039C30D6A
MLGMIKAWLIFWAAVMMPWMIPIVLVLLFVYYVVKGVASAVSGKQIKDVEVDEKKLKDFQKKLQSKNQR